MIVDIFIPCFIDQFKPEIGFNMIKVLEKVGCSINYNVEQTCCGQPAYHTGNWAECKEVGEKFIKELLNDRYIVSPANSCTSFVKKQYSELFHNTVLHNEYKDVQKKMFELTDFLVNVLKITNIGATLEGSAVLLNVCNGSNCNSQKSDAETLLEKVRGLELIALPNANECCGFGGNFSVKYESISSQMAQAKIDAILSTNAEFIISTDYACLMHLNGYIQKQNLPLKVIHIADVLAQGWD